MIRTAIFDLGGVIIPLDFPRIYAALECVSPFRADEMPERIYASGVVGPFERGEIPPEEFHRRITDTLGLNVDYARFRDLWCTVFPPYTLIPESLIESLRGRVRLLVLSNTNCLHFAYIREHYPLLRHFDDYVLSHEVGLLKPDPAIYRVVLARAGCPPQHCFFTDDREDNVAAARALGIDAVLFESADGLAGELRRRGLAV